MDWGPYRRLVAILDRLRDDGVEAIDAAKILSATEERLRANVTAVYPDGMSADTIIGLLSSCRPTASLQL